MDALAVREGLLEILLESAAEVDGCVSRNGCCDEIDISFHIELPCHSDSHPQPVKLSRE